MKSDLAILFWGSVITVLSLKGLRRGVKWAWYLIMLIPLHYLGEVLIGWPMEVEFLVPLPLLSAVAVALPSQYFARSDSEASLKG